MKLEKKFFLDSDDGIEIAKECIKNSEGDRAILNIPKSSILGESPDAFEDLKTYAEEEGVEFLIESIDDNILELASLAGINAINPVFRGKERKVSDIYPVSKKSKGSAARKRVEEKEEEEIEEEDESFKQEEVRPDVSIIFEHKARSEENKSKKEKKRSLIEKNFFNGNHEDSEKKSREPRKRMGGRKRMLMSVAIILVICLGLWGVASMLPRAKITLVLKKETATFNETAEISTKATVVNTDSAIKTIVPGELFSAKKNMFVTFDADKKEPVSYKAKGILVVSNAFSSSPQTLVATTRFEAPNGIIFRLDEKTTIPGAKISGSSVTPGSIEVNVTADEAGDESNVSPTKGWKIPGFKGTARYDKFIVENITSMQGGFIGDAPVVSDEKKAAALEDAKNSLRNLLTGEMLILMSDTFKILDDAKTFQITKNEYQKAKDDPNKMGIFVEGEMKQIAFKEETLKNALFKKYGTKYIEQGYTAERSFDITYGTSTPDFVNKIMQVPVSGIITYVHDIDPSALQKSFGAKNESELRQDIFSLPGIENATISLWPFWVKNVPTNPDKITVEIQ